MAGIHCRGCVAAAMGGTMYPVFSLDRLLARHTGAQVWRSPLSRYQARPAPLNQPPTPLRSP